MIALNNNALLMIEPSTIEPKTTDVINDELTLKAKTVWENCSYNIARAYRGVHRCTCGIMSDNYDYQTPMGRLTNSLMVHYIMHHRSSVPKEEIIKLEEEYTNIIRGN